MDATLKNFPLERQRPSCKEVYDRGKSMQDPPSAGRSVLLIIEQSIFWAQPVVEDQA